MHVLHGSSLAFVIALLFAPTANVGAQNLPNFPKPGQDPVARPESGYGTSGGLTRPNVNYQLSRAAVELDRAAKQFEYEVDRLRRDFSFETRGLRRDAKRFRQLTSDFSAGTRSNNFTTANASRSLNALQREAGEVQQSLGAFENRPRRLEDAWYDVGRSLENVEDALRDSRENSRPVIRPRDPLRPLPR